VGQIFGFQNQGQFRLLIINPSATADGT